MTDLILSSLAFMLHCPIWYKYADVPPENLIQIPGCRLKCRRLRCHCIAIFWNPHCPSLLASPALAGVFSYDENKGTIAVYVVVGRRGSLVLRSFSAICASANNHTVRSRVASCCPGMPGVHETKDEMQSSARLRALLEPSTS